MYSRWQLALKYIKYYLSASNGKGHGIHSPFVFEFVTKVLNDQKDYPEYKQVEELRQRLLHDPTVLKLEDHGAGSSHTKQDHRSVAAIARNAAKQKKFAQLLFRIARFYRPNHIIELGTSLGISSCYLAMGNPAAVVKTIEGAVAVAEAAKENFRQLEIKNIEQITGNFDNCLAEVLRDCRSIDLAFIDGNHRQEPTERYFLQLLSTFNNTSMLIFDDIHWSAEMERAWQTIKGHPSVRCSIDLFFIGIVVFREEFHEKQHFNIRF